MKPAVPESQAQLPHHYFTLPHRFIALSIWVLELQTNSETGIVLHNLQRTGNDIITNVWKTNTALSTPLQKDDLATDSHLKTVTAHNQMTFTQVNYKIWLSAFSLPCKNIKQCSVFCADSSLLNKVTQERCYSCDTSSHLKLSSLLPPRQFI